MLKVMYIVSTLANLGPINQLYNIIKNLDNNRIKPVVLTLSPEGNNSQYEKFSQLGIEIDSLNLSRVEGMFKASKHLDKKIKEIKPAVIHTHGIRADILSSKITGELTKVSTVHSFPFDDYPMKFGKFKGSLMARQHIKAIRKIEYPIACSKTLATLLNDKADLGVGYIRNGVETKFYTPTNEEEKKYYREKLGLPLKKNIFISVGSLIKIKDPITTIKAFNRQNKGEDSFLVLVGDGPLKEECQKLSSNGQVRMTGRIKNVIEYLKASDYFISSSLSEGLPNTVLEALAVGVPCCLSNIEQHKEIIGSSQKIGTLAKVGEVNSFVSAMNLIQEQNYNLLSKEAKNRVNNHLSAKLMSEKYQDLYVNLVNKKV